MDDIKIKIVVESKVIYLPLLRKAIRGICSEMVQNEETFQDIELCLNEALTNVISHAYHNEPGHEIQIIVTLYPEEGIFEIIDAGLKSAESSGFFPSNINTNLNSNDSLAESGRGLSLIYQLMDEVKYKNEEGKNILTLHKRFNIKP